MLEVRALSVPFSTTVRPSPCTVPVIRSTSIRAASAPKASTGCATAVNFGSNTSAQGKSSIATSDTSPGQDNPSLLNPFIAPMAERLFAAISAVGGDASERHSRCGRDRRVGAAEAPDLHQFRILRQPRPRQRVAITGQPLPTGEALEEPCH